MMIRILVLLLVWIVQAEDFHTIADISGAYLYKSNRFKEAATMRQISRSTRNMIDESFSHINFVSRNIYSHCNSTTARKFFHYTIAESNYVGPIELDGNSFQCVQSMSYFCRILPPSKNRMYLLHYKNDIQLVRLFMINCPTSLLYYSVTEKFLEFLASDLISNHLVGFIITVPVTMHSQNHIFRMKNLRYLDIGVQKPENLQVFQNSGQLERLEVTVYGSMESICLADLFPKLEKLVSNVELLNSSSTKLFTLPTPPLLKSFTLSIDPTAMENLSEFLYSMVSVTEFIFKESPHTTKVLSTSLKYPPNIKYFTLFVSNPKNFIQLVDSLYSATQLSSVIIDKFDMVKTKVSYLDLIFHSGAKRALFHEVKKRNYFNFEKFIYLSQKLPLSLKKLELSCLIIDQFPLLKSDMITFETPDIDTLIIRNILGWNCDSYSYLLSMISTMKSLRSLTLAFENNQVFCDKIYSLIRNGIPDTVEYLDLGFNRNDLDALHRNEKIKGIFITKI